MATNTKPRIYHLWLKSPYCYICKKRISWEATTADHVIPTSKGGDNTIKNLRPCCGPCNGKKADKMPEHLPPELLPEYVQRKIERESRWKRKQEQRQKSSELMWQHKQHKQNKRQERWKSRKKRNRGNEDAG